MDNIIDVMLQDYPFIVKDGGLATEIEKRGFSLAGRLWSARILNDNPQIIFSVHRDYLNAGADCILTASYQASIPGFLENGYSLKKAESLIRLSAKIAVDARTEFISEKGALKDRPVPVVAGSCGSYGAYLANASEYSGAFKLSAREYKDFHRPRIELLLESGCDMIAFETFPRIDEAAAAAELMLDYTDVSAWICYSVADDESISSGENFIQAVSEIKSANICAVGINCSNPVYFASLIKKCRTATDKPVVIYPNSGRVFNSGCSCWLGEDKKSGFKTAVEEWYNSGAAIIGGCCRIGPDEISEAAELRYELKNSFKK